MVSKNSFISISVFLVVILTLAEEKGKSKLFCEEKIQKQIRLSTFKKNNIKKNT